MLNEHRDINQPVLTGIRAERVIMFYIGDWDRQKIITHYIENNDVRKVLVIHSERLKQEYNIPLPHEYIEYHQTIMYKNYYRLLQWIDKYTLIITDNILVTQNRYQLDYNCINNFINQTPQRLVFNYLPFIEDKDDFMILLDFYNKNLYKGEPFRWDYFKDVNLHIKPVHLDFNFIDIPMTEKDVETYEKKKNELFEDIGLRDPDTIPRNLAILAGDLRKAKVDRDGKYTVRNARCKNLNTTLYKQDELNTIFDFPTKRTEFIDLLTLSKKTTVDVVTSELSIDKYYKNDYLAWRDRMEEFYDKANILG